MKKKGVRKLTLNRETLRDMDGRRFGQEFEAVELKQVVGQMNNPTVSVCEGSCQ